jgi:outer membrane lipoprotein-sorting protein
MRLTLHVPTAPALALGIALVAVVGSAPAPAAAVRPAAPARDPAAPKAATASSSADAHTLLKAALDYWRGPTSRTEITMTVHRPDWERTSAMRSWTRGDKDALVRFTEPAKDAGSATLKLGDDMWIFTPKLDRVLKLPYSMMAQSWMGSDFSYSDLAKSDDLLLHYTLSLTGKEEQEGHTVYAIEAVPHANAPVIWGKQTVRVRDDHLLLEEVFYDQDLKPVKKLTATAIGPLGGRTYVTGMRMEDSEKPDHWTDITYQSGTFGLDLPAGLFTVGNLRNLHSPLEKK